MANNAFSSYIITGSNEELDKLQALMEQAAANCDPYRYSFAPLASLIWGDNIPADLSMRGEWYGLTRTKKGIQFDEEADWQPHYKFWDAIATEFESLEVWFIGEEEGMGIYLKRDHPEKRFFPYNYHLDAFSPEGEDISEYFETIDEVFKYIEKLTGNKISNTEDIDSIREFWQDKDCDSFLYLNEYEYLS